MAHFYGNLKGSRGAATRCGTASSGLTVSARDGSGIGGRLLFCGPISQLVNASHVFPAPTEG